MFDIKAPKLTHSEAQDIIRGTSHAISSSKNFDIQRVQWQLSETLDGPRSRNSEEVALSIEFLEDSSSSAPIAQLLLQSKTLLVQYSPAMLRSNFGVYSVDIGKVIGEKLDEIFVEEQLSIEYLLASYSGCNKQLSRFSSTGNNADHFELSAKQARRRTRSLKYAPTYHISISLFTPGPVPTSWDIEAAISEYLLPLLESYSISNFTVDTQLQLYAPFSPSMRSPEFDWIKQQWIIREEDLGGFMDTANWPLSPNIGAGPTLNFILYVPDESLRPLVINGSGDHSWIIPQWGGVSILNHVGRIPTILSKEHLRPVLLTFSRQLLSLLGASDNPTSFPQQLQMLTRIHTLSLILSASSTLGSLAQLAESLATIPIPEEVALRVTRALDHLQMAQRNSHAGRFRSALEYARLAKAEAEKAFFEKDMVSQVYFPDEHKVAVYLPLLGPIGVTLLASLFKEIKKRRPTKSQ